MSTSEERWYGGKRRKKESGCGKKVGYAVVLTLIVMIRHWRELPNLLKEVEE